MEKRHPNNGEELTTKMHSDFKVTKETDTMHKAYSAIRRMRSFGYSAEEAASLFKISESDIEKHLGSFNELTSK